MFNDFLKEKEKEKESFKKDFNNIVESIEKTVKKKEVIIEEKKEPESLIEQKIPNTLFYNRINRYFNEEPKDSIKVDQTEVIVENLKNDPVFISKVKPPTFFYGGGGGIGSLYADGTPKLGGDLDALQHNINNVNSLNLSTNSVVIPTDVGSLYWDEKDKTLSCILEHSTIQIGQEQYIVCVNKTGAIIPNGSVVYINGAQGNRPTIALASSTVYNAACKVIGVATHDIAINQEGVITINGLVRDLPTNTYVEGDVLYLSSAFGQFTKNQPTVYNYATVRIGYIVKSHVTDGWVYVSIDHVRKEFGNVTSGNFTKFEEDGSMIMYGDATVYEDVIGNIFTARIESPSSNIVLNIDNASLTFQNDCTSADYIVISCQNPHKWEMGSSIYPHIHWEQSTSAIPNWVLGYRWQIGGRQKTSAWTYIPIYNGTVYNRTSGTLNQKSSFNSITPPINAEMSDMIQFKLIRDTTNQFGFYSGSEVGGINVELQAMDYHFKINRLGSHTEYVY